MNHNLRYVRSKGENFIREAFRTRGQLAVSRISSWQLWHFYGALSDSDSDGQLQHCDIIIIIIIVIFILLSYICIIIIIVIFILLSYIYVLLSLLLFYYIIIIYVLLSWHFYGALCYSDSDGQHFQRRYIIKYICFFFRAKYIKLLRAHTVFCQIRSLYIGDIQFWFNQSAFLPGANAV